MRVHTECGKGNLGELPIRLQKCYGDCAKSYICLEIYYRSTFLSIEPELSTHGKAEELATSAAVVPILPTGLTFIMGEDVQRRFLKTYVLDRLEISRTSRAMMKRKGVVDGG